MSTPQLIPLEIFRAGRLSHFTKQWSKLTNDERILDIVQHCHIEFDSTEPPTQNGTPRGGAFSKRDAQAINTEIAKLKAKGVIEETSHCIGEYISPIFLRPKKDGTFRLILNLKDLNQSVTYHHFKMESLMSAVRLMTENCYMTSIDL